MEVALAGVVDAELLGRSLALSYESNPLVRWMFADDLSPRRLASLFATLVRRGIDEGRVYRTPDGDGAAIWFPPVERPSDLDVAGNTSQWSSGRGGAALGVLAAARPAEPHFYLDAVGVVPSKRRSGSASALLAPVLADCDRHGVVAYLENSDPLNTSFYAKHGFKAIGPLAMPEGCPPVIAMHRHPRPAP